MAKKIDVCPIFDVRHVPGKNARAFWASEITVSIAGTVISKATFGGRWTAQQAEKEFQRNRARFSVEPGCEGMFRLAAA